MTSSMYHTEQFRQSVHIRFQYAACCCKVCAQDSHPWTEGTMSISTTIFISRSWMTLGQVSKSLLGIRLGGIVMNQRPHNSLCSGRAQHLQRWKRQGKSLFYLIFTDCAAWNYPWWPKGKVSIFNFTVVFWSIWGIMFDKKDLNCGMKATRFAFTTKPLFTGISNTPWSPFFTYPTDRSPTLWLLPLPKVKTQD